MQLQEWLNYIASIHNKRVDLSLDRVQEVMQRLTATHRKQYEADGYKPFIITVGGTNGKGSLVYALNQILLDRGLRVAAYTSPHLYQFHERIMIHGVYPSDEDLCQAFAQIEILREGITLSFFEFTTLAAFWLFMQQPLDVWILEVGLGGRLDAVNIMDPDIAVITSIDMDHCAWLGNSITAIAMEKIGIARPDKPLVIFQQFPNEAYTQLQQAGVPCYYPEYIPTLEQAIDAGKISRHTLAKTVCVTRLLPWKITHAQLIASMHKLSIPARKQIFYSYQRTWLLDTAHNPAASQWLQRDIQHRYANKKIYAIFSCLADKDIERIMEPWSASVQHWHVIDLNPHHRAIPRKKLKAWLANKNWSYSLTNLAWLEQNWHPFVSTLPQDENNLIIVFGSFIHLGFIWHQLRSGL